MNPQFYLITGVMASGKSTVAECLAQELEPCAHVRGDAFRRMIAFRRRSCGETHRRMIASGRREMGPDPDPEALRQYALRCDLAAQTARTYFQAGFSVVLQDNYYGRALPDMLERLRGLPVRVVRLCPRPEVVEQRERDRGKNGYTRFSVRALCANFLRETPAIGLALDNSAETPQQTAARILANRWA